MTVARPLAVLLPLAAAVAGCGSAGGGEEDGIRSSLGRFIAKNEPRGCDVQTARYLRNTADQADLDVARRQCRERESGRRIGVWLTPRGAAVSDIAVDGARAIAKARLRDGELDGQVIRITLVEEGETWKVDRVDDIRIDGALRRTIDRQLSPSLERALADDVPPHRLRPAVACTVTRVRRSVSNAQLSAAMGGLLTPGTMSRAFEQAASRCRSAGIDERDYEVAVPRGFRDITRQAGGARFDLVLKSARGTVTVIEEFGPAVESATLEEYYEASRAKSAAARPREPEPARLGGVDALTYEFRDRTASGQSISSRQVMALRGGVAYFVTFGAAPKDFDRVSEDFDAILSSWRWR